MAISKALSPYDEVILNLIGDVNRYPERIPQLQRDYLGTVIKISRDQSRGEVERYLSLGIRVLYGENEDQREADISRLVLGGEPETVELTRQERLTVASLLINTYRQRYGRIPIV